MSSGFVTESEITEARKKRQEEWERVRKPSDPLERPEEPYDSRSLYDRLQEQKQKKDMEYEEAHKLKNMIKGLDDDEIEFLDLVDRSKLAADRKKELEEKLELNDYRNRVATLQEKKLEERLQAEIALNKPKPVTNRSSQQKLLKGIVVQKKRKASGNIEEREEKQVKKDEETQASEKHKSVKIDSNQEENGKKVSDSGLKCLAILPGLGCYGESTTSDENSSDSEIEDCPLKDILERKIVEKNGNS